ncbi:hypothetical protein CALCODRAFT_555507 [Calocera cornea HHB12733]|uniref:MARVEL domain-containing protein n=1 Tax=Calocera cornea HHB12733 TaxID=1353952 RepID=A0A165FSZ0_9BASI|nr:hypothetical protein CALCODRAFT_555507 [Calocera cornea HHB12733]
MLRRLRILSLVTCTIFGVIFLGLSCNLIAWTYFDFSVGVATGVLMLVTCPIVLAIDWWRRGVFTSWTSVELGWMGVLWVLSLTTGALAINDWEWCNHSVCVPQPKGFEYCSGPPKPVCREMQAVAGFAIMTTVILFSLWSWTLYVGIRAHIDGDPFIWTSPAHEYEFMPVFPQHRTDGKRMQPNGEFGMDERPTPAATPLPTHQALPPTQQTLAAQVVQGAQAAPTPQAASTAQAPPHPPSTHAMQLEPATQSVPTTQTAPTIQVEPSSQA